MCKCDVTRLDRNKNVKGSLKIAGKMRENRLRLFGHIVRNG